MASTHSGPLDSLVSIKSTPEIEVNSLQLNRDQSVASQTPQAQGFSIDSSSLNDKPHTVKFELPTGDDTIQQILTQPISPEKKPTAQVLPSRTISLAATPASKTEAIATVPASGMAEQPDSRGDSVGSANAKVSAYARLEFENFIFYVQTLQVVLGRKSENDQSHSVDVHLGNSKAISRKHAKIFYNFGTERFELSIQGKNGAFVDDVFVERGATVPLTNKSKIQIGQIVFRFVLPGANPQEKMESPSKPLNPSDAISLKSTLYTNQGSTDGLTNSRGDTPPLTSKDFEPVTGSAAIATASSGSFPNIIVPAQKKAKEKKPPKPPKPPKKVYTLEEIPEEYRTKPNCSYSNLIATCLRTHGTPKGMSLAEIYKSIRDIFPYYKYCPDGWQSSVRHNLSLNKAFRKVSKEGKGWLWGLDEEYCAEKERTKKKQAAAAAAKAKAAALKLEQQQQQQQQKLQQQKQLQMAQAVQQPFQQQNTVPGANFNPQLSSLQGSQVPLQQQPLQAHQLQQFQPQSFATPVKQEPSLMKGISLQSVHGQQHQQQPLSSTPQQHGNQQQQQHVQQQLIQKLPVSQSHQKPLQGLGAQSQQQGKGPSIQAQLAANRGVPIQNLARQVPPPSPQQKSNPLGADTKKALAHLQQQLVLLSKDLRTLVDKPTISAILTQAIAMTIAQVTQAAKAKGITTDPLATLIDTNPQQLTRILTVALNAATFKVTNGRIKAPLSVPQSGVSSRAATPTLSTPPLQRQQAQYNSPQSQAPSQPKPQPPILLQPQQSLQQTRLQPQLQPSIPQSRQQHIPPQPQCQAVHLQSQPQLHPDAHTQTDSQVSQMQPVPPKTLEAQSGVTTAKNQHVPVSSSTTEQQLASKTSSMSGNVVPSSHSGTGPTSQGLPPKSSVSSSDAEASLSLASHEPSQSVVSVPLPPNVGNLASAESTSQQSQRNSSISVNQAPAQSSSSTNGDIETVTSTIGLDELNDPEFNKVLESLSKEGTPGLESDDQKILDDDELNRLLAADFSEPRQKRSFDEVDPSEQGANKVLRTE